jgi:hypothetical protein
MSEPETEMGRELVADWRREEGDGVTWILKLAEFDRDGLWAIDGFTNCVSWLEVKCEMARGTAFEKVRVAHELTRRPIVRAAFESGTLPFTKIQAITRLGGLNDDRDQTFVDAALGMSIRALEWRVRMWNFANGDGTEPDMDRYGLRREPGFMDGFGRLVMEAPNDMLDRVVGIVDAYDRFLFHNGTNQLRLMPVDESRNGTHPQVAYGDDDAQAPRVDEQPRRPLPARRLDLFFDLLEEVVLVNDDKIDPEVASIGITVQYEDLIANRPYLVLSDQESLITGEAVRRLACDAGIHRMVIRGVSEFLDIGRKTRIWTTAQRRAIRARHNHRCAAAGCNRRITQIHHIEWWEDGGATSIDNGVPLCSYHHHLVHDGGWTITYNPHTGITRLEGPQGQVLETQVDVGYRAA